MKIDRLFEIIYILLDKKQVTAKELAEHFEVSTKTIYRDMESLSMANIPIYTDQGKGGGIFLDQDFVLNKSVLSDQDKESILMGLANLKTMPTEEVKKTLTKLGNFLNKEDFEYIQVDFSRVGRKRRRK